MKFLLILLTAVLVVKSASALDCFVCADGLFHTGPGSDDMEYECRDHFNDHKSFEKECDDFEGPDFDKPRCHETWSTLADGTVNGFIRGCMEASNCHNKCEPGSQDNTICNYCCDEDYCNSGYHKNGVGKAKTGAVFYVVLVAIFWRIYAV
ncbi:uncharacterized protein [Ptychodera flava]|uniref:uncharacterized protein n=1 Tax=Ptychodera flava TaxID=63121 RepID=UPI00396AAA1D